MHNGTLKCLRTKNGMMRYGRTWMRAAQATSLARLYSPVCRVREGGFMCRRRYLGARLSARTEWLGDAAAVQK